MSSFAIDNQCNRTFEVYMYEQGKRRLPSHMEIRLLQNKLYWLDTEIPKGEYVFTYLIRYDQGKIYTRYKQELNSFDLMLSEKGESKKILSISSNQDKRITIDTNGDSKIAPSFLNMNFDENGNIFLLALNMEVVDNCKVKTYAELKTATYSFDKNSLVVNTDHSYFTMKGSEQDF